jgi:oxalate---CoA ligase
MSGFTCAPLNPNYSEQELKFYFSDIKANAVLVQPGIETPAIAVARSMDIPIISLTPDKDKAGIFELSGELRGERQERDSPQPEDITLLLHTSGTTSRPKLVPLLQSSVTISSQNIAHSLSLASQDRCLSVMPPFHVHGLIGALLSTIVSGGSIICTQGFRSPDFLNWIGSYHPTWYTAVPAIHQKVLEQATTQADKARLSGLRFIRSASSPLPPVVAEGLESTFGVPVIEAYGMTEASHQIAANPLPPLPRKAGSVGKGTGVEIAILNEHGDALPGGSQGQIALKGQSIMPRYENNREANEKSFVNGWFLTGDLGHLDGDGYLYIDARIKEVINRGGEKVSPREVEEVLLSHPAVSEVAVFSIPDAKLGKNVGAAVVLKPGEKSLLKI